MFSKSLPCSFSISLPAPFPDTPETREPACDRWQPYNKTGLGRWCAKKKRYKRDNSLWLAVARNVFVPKTEGKIIINNKEVKLYRSLLNKSLACRVQVLNCNAFSRLVKSAKQSGRNCSKCSSLK